MKGITDEIKEHEKHIELLKKLDTKANELVRQLSLAGIDKNTTTCSVHLDNGQYYKVELRNISHGKEKFYISFTVRNNRYTLNNGRVKVKTSKDFQQIINAILTTDNPIDRFKNWFHSMSEISDKYQSFSWNQFKGVEDVQAGWKDEAKESYRKFKDLDGREVLCDYNIDGGKIRITVGGLRYETTSFNKQMHIVPLKNLRVDEEDLMLIYDKSAGMFNVECKMPQNENHEPWIKLEYNDFIFATDSESIVCIGALKYKQKSWDEQPELEKKMYRPIFRLDIPDSFHKKMKRLMTKIVK